jgi:hypothetical protein
LDKNRHKQLVQRPELVISLGSPPTAAQNATVNNGGTAQIASGVTAPTTAVANTLTIGSSSAVELLAGGTLTVTTLASNNGGVFQLSGTLTVTNPVQIGNGGIFLASGGTKNTRIFMITEPFSSLPAQISYQMSLEPAV